MGVLSIDDCRMENEKRDGESDRGKRRLTAKPALSRAEGTQRTQRNLSHESASWRTNLHEIRN